MRHQMITAEEAIARIQRGQYDGLTFRAADGSLIPATAVSQEVALARLMLREWYTEVHPREVVLGSIAGTSLGFLRHARLLWSRLPQWAHTSRWELVLRELP